MMEGHADLPVRGGPRPRFVSATGTTEQDGIRIRVTLEYGGREFVGESAGVGDEERLHLAAEAAITALEQVVDRPGHFHLVGAKRIQAFDSPAILVSVRTTDERALDLLGCLPAEEDVVGSAAKSVLKATNRLVEAMLRPEADAA